MTPPLVTLLLTTYKQEPFVREAVRSALAQDYQPLQILISDDASPDRTFDAIAEETRGYLGPHEVQIRRNATRMRSVRHVEDALTLARGELVVMAHGDDVSLPRRVSALVEAWRRERVSMVSSNALIIDRAGNPRQPIAKEAPARRIPPADIVANVWLWPMLGATIAFEPEVVRSFAPLGERLAAGLDHVLPLRAAAMKGFYYLDEPLVLYRRHGGNMSNFVVDRAALSRAAFQETDIAFQLTLHMQWYEDISALCSARPDDAALHELRLPLSDRLQSELRYWCRLRAALRAEGKLPTWIDEADMLARPLTFHMAMDREILAEAADSESSAGASSAARGTG